MLQGLIGLRESSKLALRPSLHCRGQIRMRRLCLRLRHLAGGEEQPGKRGWSFQGAEQRGACAKHKKKTTIFLFLALVVLVVWEGLGQGVLRVWAQRANNRF